MTRVQQLVEQVNALHNAIASVQEDCSEAIYAALDNAAENLFDVEQELKRAVRLEATE